MYVPGGSVSSLKTIFTYFPAKLDCLVPDSKTTLGGRLTCSEFASSSAQIPGKTDLLILAANF